jgi:hypothetical protein
MPASLNRKAAEVVSRNAADATVSRRTLLLGIESRPRESHRPSSITAKEGSCRG